MLGGGSVPPPLEAICACSLACGAPLRRQPPHARKRERVTARSELERRFAHYLRAVILRTPRVATAVMATAAATSSDETGSTTFGRERGERGRRGGEEGGDK